MHPGAIGAEAEKTASAPVVSTVTEIRMYDVDDIVQAALHGPVYPQEAGVSQEVRWQVHHELLCALRLSVVETDPSDVPAAACDNMIAAIREMKAFQDLQDGEGTNLNQNAGHTLTGMQTPAGHALIENYLKTLRAIVARPMEDLRKKAMAQR